MQAKTSAVQSLLIDTREVSQLLNLSCRSVHRLVEAGRMPRPCKLGGLLRWRREVVLEWIAAGCPPCEGQLA